MKKLSKRYTQTTISRPLNTTRNVHVGKDFVWVLGQGQSPHTSFVLGDLLGEGAHGQVFKATHTETGFILAIKIVRVGAINEKQKKLLDQEVDILNRCRHPNIVNYYGSFHHDDSFWILMDFCGQGSARGVVDKKLIENNNAFALKEFQSCEFLYCTLKGLGYLHSQGIIHRDIKAS
eukprot:TRINITY_DN1585_c0_g1_i1.p1 TRINITY_DN1585_c0_g1~~TRINITY_DN1585_c0_g1_i1.p1  ORF type:complete len:177 (+),score=10.70 TRINITY_DN1585_c0_g1_i1:78-608(+)